MMRVGCIGFSTEQGIGYLMRDFYAHGIITDVAVLRHGRRPDHFEWYERPLVIGDLRAQQWELQQFCAKMDAMLFIETPFRYELYDFCRAKGIRTALVPMYEGYPQHPPALPDCFACPSLLDQRIFMDRCQRCKGMVWTNEREMEHPSREYQEPCPAHPFVPIPTERPWALRTRAKRFLHNGGHLGLRGHKGTLELLQAMEFVKSDLSLNVRAQDVAGMQAIISQVPRIRNDERVTISMGGLRQEDLFNGHDALVQPEKYNGLSLPLQEARASGMLVVTTDRHPHNTWLPQWPLIPVRSYSKQRVAGSCLEYDEALVEPQLIAETLDRLNGADIEEYSLSGKAWAEMMSWEVLKPRWLEVLKG